MKICSPPHVATKKPRTYLLRTIRCEGGKSADTVGLAPCWQCSLINGIRGKMADDIDEPLAEGWEAVVDDTGRTYWWNTETNETTWTKPVAVLAKKGLAAGAAPA